MSEEATSSEAERDFGPQPLADLLEKHELRPHDLVEASQRAAEPGEAGRVVTHKMVSRGLKGRRLSVKVRIKIVDALNVAAGTDYGPRDAFNYLKPR